MYAEEGGHNDVARLIRDHIDLHYIMGGKKVRKADESITKNIKLDLRYQQKNNSYII